MRLFFAAMKIASVLLAGAVLLLGDGVPVYAQHGPVSPLFEDIDTTEPPIDIILSSDPFPMTVGMADVAVILYEKSETPEELGTTPPINDALVVVSAQMDHMGMGLPISGQAYSDGEGVYRVPLIWSMTGLWLVQVDVYLADAEEPITELYEIYIYPIILDVPDAPPVYHSLRKNVTFLTEAPDEFRILIPQGTKSLVKVGQDRDIIPDEITMSVSGMNTIVIRNDDIEDHTVGPFFIRSGEVIRQKFTRPTIYEGVCSINFLAEIRIIVEE